MPPISRKSLRQRAVYWAYSGTDRNGDPVLSSPVEIKVRWETDRSESINDDGTPISIDGNVKVDRAIVVNSVLWLGRLSELPTPVTNPMIVVSTSDTPNMKGRVIERWVVLRKYSNHNLPTVS